LGWRTAIILLMMSWCTIFLLDRHTFCALYRLLWVRITVVYVVPWILHVQSIRFFWMKTWHSISPVTWKMIVSNNFAWFANDGIKRFV
jgi:hypothetical protein